MHDLRHGKAWIVVAALAIVLGAALTVPFRGLWDPDETRYACVAREMLAGGNWAVPQLDGVPYTHKPPLFFWLVASLRRLGLPWTVAGVLPSVLACLATLAALPALASSVGLGRSEGAMAGAFLVSSPLLASLALAARMDMLLVLEQVVALTLLAHLLGVAEGAPAPRWSHLGFWGVSALGILVKGPVALALPLATALSYRLLVRSRPALRPLLVGWGPPLLITALLAWLVPAGLHQGAGYLVDTVVRQTTERITGAGYAHPQPIFFYLLGFPLGALPWSLLAVVAMVAALRRREHAGLTFLAASLASGLVLFSLVSGKLLIYLLPLLPSAALLAVSALRSESRGSRAAVFLGAGVLALAGLAAIQAPVWRPDLGGHRVALAIAGLTVAAPALATLALLAQGTGSMRRAARCLLLAGLAAPVVSLPIAVHLLDPAMSGRRIAEELRAAEPAATTVYVYRAEQPSASFLLGRRHRRLDTPEQLRATLAAGRWVAIRERPWDVLPPTITGRATERGPFPAWRLTLKVVGWGGAGEDHVRR